MFARVFGLGVVFAAAAVLMSASSAAVATAQRGATVDVSTRAAVVRYLHSIHLDPRGVVIQRGARNYAGSNCPGTGWSCTSTAHPVVQVASAGGRNSFVCSAAHCAVVQVSVGAAGRIRAVTNTAKCVKSAVLKSMACSIHQSSATDDNLAIVFENIKPGLLSGTSTATITQTATGASNGNTACVTQNVKLVKSAKLTPFVAALNAHQTVTITQDATGSGANSAQFGATSAGACNEANPLAQNQTLKSVAKGPGKITQKENATDHGTNLVLAIAQNQGVGFGVASGTNNATFAQTNTLTAIANSTHGPIVQTQSSPNGGLTGTINQDSTGVSTASATQTEIQCEDAAKTGLVQCDTNDEDASEAPASLTQTQFGPVHKGAGDSTQTGNANDTFTVNQSSTQDNDTGAGQTNVVQGDCRTEGNCTVDQSADVNGQQTSNTQSGQDINASLTCTGSDCTNTVRRLNPLDGGGGSCADGFASGTGFQGIPQKVTENVDLSQYDGQTIRLRFSFSTADPSFNAYEGWYLKNILVTGKQGNTPVTVFSDPVAHGDTNFTASNGFGTAPGWHVSDRRNATFGGPTWWYGDEQTGTFQSPNPVDGCSDSSSNAGSITSTPITLASSSMLSFDTLWQIESVAPTSFDLMDVEVLPGG